MTAFGGVSRRTLARNLLLTNAEAGGSSLGVHSHTLAAFETRRKLL